MSDFVSLLEKTRRAYATVAALERVASEDPADRSIQANLLTSRRLAARLEADFAQSAELNEVDVLRYRIVPEPGQAYSVRHVTRSLERFQEMFTLVFAALRERKPRHRARVTASLAEETALHFGYSYPGSLGVVLTAPSSRDLFSTKYQDTIQAIHKVIRIKDKDEAIDMAHTLGGAVVRTAYEWSSENWSAEYSVDLQWKKSDGAYAGEHIDVKQMEQIVRIFGQTSETSVRVTSTRGVLVGANVNLRTFHFVVPNAESYKGSFGPEYRPATVEVGVTYKARIATETVTHYATGKEETVHRLLDLK